MAQQPRRQIQLDTVVQHNGEPLPEHLLVDETLTITMSNGLGFSLGLRLTPEEAIGFASYLYYHARLALESGELSNAEPAGQA